MRTCTAIVFCMVVTACCVGRTFASVIVPAEGSTLNYTHVKFRWEPYPFISGPGGNAAYQLQVVEDNGAGDPFQGNPSVIFLFHIDPSEPRVLVTEGLEWGKSYAWRTRAFEYDPHPWSATRRFSTAALPAYLPELTVTVPEGGGDVEPGVTIFSLNGQPVPFTTILYLGADGQGRVIWFLERSQGSGMRFQIGTDLRQLSNGRFLLTGASRGWEVTPAGGVAWASPALTPYPDAQGPNELEHKVHHEVYPMPSGNRLCLTHSWRDVVRNGETQRWRSDKLVEYDRRTNEPVWTWDAFDHLSTEDFDEEIMSAPSNFGDYNWTHTNAMIYNEQDNSVYISCRHLSRIVRIDYATGDIVYQMGFDMPSGDVDFGDNLFSFQHAPQMLPDGNMLVFDNGNRRDHIVQTPETGVSKAVELVFTNEAGTPTNASIAWSFTLPEYCDFVGDADRQPGGTTLITLGGTVSGMNRSILEVDAAGQEIWRLSLSTNFTTIYRAERIASLIVDTPGDTDGDWDLDLHDFGRFQTCYTGPGPAGLTFPCTLSDTDGDDDVDLDDLSVLVDLRTGPL